MKYLERFVYPDGRFTGLYVYRQHAEAIGFYEVTTSATGTWRQTPRKIGNFVIVWQQDFEGEEEKGKTFRNACK